ncbi:MAG: arginine--tRNA ligase [Gemmatimonadota bacterium]
MTDTGAVEDAVRAALKEMGVEQTEVHLERPRDPTHGDLATNVAMTLASTLRRPPREIALELARRIPVDGGTITAVEVAGPGFLNFRLSAASLGSQLIDALVQGAAFGRSQEGKGEAMLVEFVSANPTGPLHLGHGRQAALGDAISSLLEWTGWKVHREFYYNDAGRQMERLGESVWARYQQALGGDTPVPEDGYQGEYVGEVAQTLLQEWGDRYRDDTPPEVLDRMRLAAAALLRNDQDRDLTRFRVHFNQYFLESSLYDEGKVDETIRLLDATGLVYREGGAVWLRTTEFGDQKDRVMVKGDGSPTYFLPDVAYHRTKWERGFQHVVNIQGADHHGTVTRVRAGLQALGLPAGYPEYVLHQMVTVERGGEEVKLSKRAGSYTTLHDLMDEVGVDVARYFFLMRKAEAHLVFDLDQALDQSEKNPVFKVQYAHARICSIFRKAGVQLEELDAAAAELDLLTHESERNLVQEIGEFPQVVARAAAARAPHVVCEYLERTAGLVNSWYHAGNPARAPELAVLHSDPRFRTARLVLAGAARTVLANGLGLLGVHAPERMEREEHSHQEES